MLSPAVVPPPDGRDISPAAAAPPPRAARAATSLPDVAVSTAPPFRGTLDRVGMSGVQAVAAVTVDGRPALLPAICELAVSLDDPRSRGIHMSRLYLRAQAALGTRPHAGPPPADAGGVDAGSRKPAAASEAAFCEVSLTLPVRQPALVSGESGWRHYPVRCGAWPSPRAAPSRSRAAVRRLNTPAPAPVAPPSPGTSPTWPSVDRVRNSTAPRRSAARVREWLSRGRAPSPGTPTASGAKRT